MSSNDAHGEPADPSRSVNERAREIARSIHDAPDAWDQRLGEAERLLRAELERSPENPLTHANLGAVLCDRGEHREAVQLLRRAVELGSDSRQTLFNLAVSILNAGSWAGRPKEFLLAEERPEHPDQWEVFFDPHGH